MSTKESSQTEEDLLNEQHEAKRQKLISFVNDKVAECQGKSKEEIHTILSSVNDELFKNNSSRQNLEEEYVGGANRKVVEYYMIRTNEGKDLYFDLLMVGYGEDTSFSLFPNMSCVQSEGSQLYEDVGLL
jgi:hypothetical protein